MDASQTARALNDVSLSVINSGVAVDAGFTPTKDAIFLEPVDDRAALMSTSLLPEKKMKQTVRIKKSLILIKLKQLLKSLKKRQKVRVFQHGKPLVVNEHHQKVQLK